MDKQINQVLASKEYSKFSFMEENRDLNLAKVEQLKKSMKLYPLEKPIDVNEKYEIIDGQHRFFAWQDLGLPVIFIIHKGWGIKEVPILNINQSNWNPSDYVKMYSKLGNEEYIKYKEFQDRWGFPHTSNLQLLLGGEENRKDGSRMTDRFRNGEFQVKQWHKANIIAENISKLKDFWPHYKQSNFVRAYMRVFGLKNFENDKLLKKMEINGRKLVGCSTSDQYFEALREIYNYMQRGDEGRI